MVKNEKFHHKTRIRTTVDMDTQKFLGLLEEVLGRELVDMLPLLSWLLTKNSKNRSIANNNRDTPHRLLPLSRVTHNSLAIDPLRPAFSTSTVGSYTGLHSRTKALETFVCPSKIPLPPATVALHATRRGAANQTCCISSHHCCCGDRFGEWRVARLY